MKDDNQKRAIGLTAAIILLISSLGAFYLFAKTPDGQSPEMELAQQNLVEYAVEVVDAAGNKVGFDNIPQRIGIAYAPAGNIICLLGAAPKLVTIDEETKKNKLMLQIYPALDKITTFKVNDVLNEKELLAASPQILFIDMKTFQDKQLLEKLRKIGTKYYVTDFDSIESLKKTVNDFGALIGKRTRAAEFCTYTDELLSEVSLGLTQVSAQERQRVYHSVFELNRTDDFPGLSYDVFKAAGMINVFSAGSSGGKNYVTTEQILETAPDTIFVNEPAALKDFRNDKNYATMKAVQKGKLYQLPSGLTRWATPASAETALAAAWAAKTAYPQAFKSLDIKKKTSDFYTKFLNYTPDEKTLNLILSGKGI